MKKLNNWFVFADEDLHTAEITLEEGIYNQTCFHSQQGVEKVLKGFLRVHKKNIPRTHLLSKLLNLCIKIDEEFKELRKYCRKLDKYYIPTRYPDVLPGMLPNGPPTKKDAEEALSILKEIIKFVEQKLSK